MTLIELLQQGNERINRLRRVQRIIEKDAFALAWNEADVETQKTIHGLCILGNDALLESWLKSRKQLELAGMSTRDLRKLASLKGIQYYSAMSKSQLIWEIGNAQEEQASVIGGTRIDEGHHVLPGIEMGKNQQKSI